MGFFVGDLDQPTDEPLHQSFPKPERRKRTKARKDRAEAKVKSAVRSAVVARDGLCRFRGHNPPDWFRRPYPGNAVVTTFTGQLVRDERQECVGASEWAHMHVKRRSQTRGQTPEVRHTTADSLMLCTRHHDEYDGRAKPRLRITALTRKGADGPLKFTRGKS